MPGRNLPLKLALVRDGRPAYIIGALAEVNPNTLSGYVSGKTVPSKEAKERIALVLGEPVDAIFPSNDEALAS